jgi:hypothetical protein
MIRDDPIIHWSLLRSNQVIRQQEVRNTFPDDVLVIAVCAYQLSLADLRLHQQVMQVLQHLLVFLEVFGGWRYCWKSWKSELWQC